MSGYTGDAYQSALRRSVRGIMRTIITPSAGILQTYFGGQVVIEKRSLGSLTVTLALASLLTACAGQPDRPNLARQCEAGLSQAGKELDLAKAKGFSGTVEWAKAASLLSAAAVQKQFEKYPNCVEKVKKARYYIRESQR